MRKPSPLLISVARGDTFDEAEEPTVEVTTFTPTLSSVPVTPPSLSNSTRGPAAAVDTEAKPCSGRPFDAFLQLKNGSIFAFRGKPGNLKSTGLLFSAFILKHIALIPDLCFLLGEYFFELDDTSVLPGYPKLIKDVWGIPGPIDAAFTRINCQGKTYIFKVCLSGVWEQPEL